MLGGLFQHSPYFLAKGLSLTVGGDHLVYLSGGFHGEEEVVMVKMGAGQLFSSVGHTRGQGIAHQIAVARTLGGVLTEDGEFFPHAILQPCGVLSADVSADGVGGLVAVDLPNGAFFQGHEGETAVDHATCGGVSLALEGKAYIPHAGDGQLGGEDEIVQPQGEQTGGGRGVGGVEAEIAVEGDLP